MRGRPARRVGQALLAAALGTVLAAASQPAVAQRSPARDTPNMDGRAEAQSLGDPAATDQTAPASGADSPTALIPDPWSGPNHAFYRLSTAIDRAAIAPVIRVYIRVVPKPIRTGLGNAVHNLNEPRTVANDILQGQFKRAGTATARFAINSTVGVAGLVDVAGRSGLERHDSDFGQTMGRYGVKSGPYIFVPLVGPSSVRDGVGRIVDAFADPLTILAGGLNTPFGGVRAGVAAVDSRSSVDDQLQQVDSEFTDPYASIRSVYSQRRANQIEIARGHPQGDVERLPDFGPPPQTPPTGQARPTRPRPDAAEPGPPSPSPPPCPPSGCS